MRTRKHLIYRIFFSPALLNVTNCHHYLLLFYQSSCSGEHSLLGAVSSRSESKDDRGGEAVSEEEELAPDGLLRCCYDAQHRSPHGLVQVNIYTLGTLFQERLII